MKTPEEIEPFHAYVRLIAEMLVDVAMLAADKERARIALVECANNQSALILARRLAEKRRDH